MTTLAIEINDASLVVADAQRVRASEPGYALVERGKIVATGTEAYRQWRLKPRQVSSTFWANLGLAEGSAGVEGVASAADLAYAQLDALWKAHGSGAREVVLVVPARYGAPELGLLLGLAQEVGVPVRAMVDAAVGASTKPYPGRQLVYADAALHRVGVTPLSQSEQVAAGRESALETVGLTKLTESLAHRVAELFVLATRFDPFREAASEQLVYDRLPDWLRAVHEHGEAELVLPFRGEEYVAPVRAEQLLGAASGFYRALVQLIAQSREPGQALTVQLSDRLAALPGIAAQLTRLDDAEVVSLAPGHTALAVLRALDAIDDGRGQVKLLKQLPWREAAVETQPERFAPEPQPDARSASSRPTHIVYRGTARPIDSHGLVVGREALEGRATLVVDDPRGGVSAVHCEIVLRDGEIKLIDLSRHGTFVNEKRVSGETALEPADVIRVGAGAELLAIRVEGGHGAAA